MTTTFTSTLAFAKKLLRSAKTKTIENKTKITKKANTDIKQQIILIYILIDNNNILGGSARQVTTSGFQGGARHKINLKKYIHKKHKNCTA